MLKIKRIYEPASPSDGARILVDRLWPRGISKEKAKIDLWLKEIAPSTKLRQWFGHDPGKWAEFKQRYFFELNQANALEDLKKLNAENPNITLLYAAKDPQHNHAIALKEYLEDILD